MKKKFKMETTRSIQKALSPGDWVTCIDLKDAYFHTSPKGGLLGHRSPRHPTPQTHYLSSSVFGPLIPQSHVKNHLSGTHPDSTRKSPSPGLPSELGQVGTCPDSKVCLPRRGLRSSSWAGQAFRGSSSKRSGPLQNTAQTTPPDSLFSPSAVRGSQLSSRNHSLYGRLHMRPLQLFLISQWPMALNCHVFRSRTRGTQESTCLPPS